MNCFGAYLVTGLPSTLSGGAHVRVTEVLQVCSVHLTLLVEEFGCSPDAISPTVNHHLLLPGKANPRRFWLICGYLGWQDGLLTAFASGEFSFPCGRLDCHLLFFSTSSIA